jgi:hypothetical protein
MPIPIRRLVLLSLLPAAASCAPWRAGTETEAGVLLEDGFDGENGERAALMYDGFAQWMVKGGTVDLVGAGSRWDFQPGNGLYVDLDGDRPDGVRFEPGVLVSRERFRLARGAYELGFRLAGSQRGDANTVEIRLGGVFHERITLPDDAPFQRFVRTVRVRRATTGRLSFDNAGADGYGLLLDDVTLRRLR